MAKVIVFACIHNAGRSQMAAAFFNQLADASKAIAISAGTEPATKVHPEVLETMKELDIDLSNAKPSKLTEELVKGASLLITMGCGEKCPYVPGLRIIDWQIEDPKSKSEAGVKVIRDAIKNLVLNLISQNNWQTQV